MTDHERDLLEVLNQIDNANDQLQEFFPDLERVLSTEVMTSLSAALRSIDSANRKLINALGGTHHVIQLQIVLEKEEEG